MTKPTARRHTRDSNNMRRTRARRSDTKYEASHADLHMRLHKSSYPAPALAGPFRQKRGRLGF